MSSEGQYEKVHPEDEENDSDLTLRQDRLAPGLGERQGHEDDRQSNTVDRVDLEDPNEPDPVHAEIIPVESEPAPTEARGLKRAC